MRYNPRRKKMYTHAEMQKLMSAAIIIARMQKAIDTLLNGARERVRLAVWETWLEAR